MALSMGTVTEQEKQQAFLAIWQTAYSNGRRHYRENGHVQEPLNLPR